MEQLIKLIASVKVDIVSLDKIVLYWLISELVRWVFGTIIFGTLFIILYKVVKNIGTGKWN